MPVLRNRISAIRAGGPRQFAELRDRVLVKAAQDRTEEVRKELQGLGFQIDELNNAPVIAAEPEEAVDTILDRVTEAQPARQIRNGIEEIREARENNENIVDITESAVRATGEILVSVREIAGVNFVEFVRTEADFGPENLRMSPSDMDDVEPDAAADAAGNLESLYEEMGIYDAWETHDTRGENAIGAVFDTGFAEDLIDSSRIVGTFHGESVDSAFASAEGHGTMCAGAMLANKEEGLPFDGVAPDAGVILVRTTDENGQIKTSTISKAWDWLMDLDVDRPIVANHSYGTPLCSGRPKQKFCGSAVNDVISVATSTSNITAFYAAGNEAMRCGHRQSGLTNAITGTNSIEEVVTVGAMLTNRKGPQRYSSHGRGDCAPIADPKPNVSAPIPKVTYYGGEDGWKLKDMSVGPLGSGGGTSHASPSTGGIGVLLQSKAASRTPEQASQSSGSVTTVSDSALQTEEIKQIIHETAESPRSNHVNSFGLFFSQEGYDARYGHGEVKVDKALSMV